MGVDLNRPGPRQARQGAGGVNLDGGGTPTVRTPRRAASARNAATTTAS